MTSAFPWSAVIKHTPSAADTHSTTWPRQRSVASTAAITAGILPECPTMSGFAKLTTANRNPSPIALAEARRHLVR